MNITLFSQYPHFTQHQIPKFIEWTKGDTPIHAYVNEYCWNVKQYDARNIAIMIEPRSIIPGMYDYMRNNHDKFRYIFTHDSEMLQYPNARVLYFGGVWEADPDRKKTKDISMISSNKTMCPLHNARIQLARELENKIDTFGTYKGSDNWVSTADTHAPYRFAVVVENYIDDYYFTEKICNCFANKTIPIYYGARKISEIFNTDGIIEVPTLDSVPALIDAMDWKAAYEIRLDAVEDNYKRVQDFYCFEDHFFKQYRDLLEGMQ